MELPLNQQITLWKTKRDNFGKNIFELPQAVAGRWEDGRKTFMDSEGVKQESKFVCVLECDVAAGDYVAPGDFTTSRDPTTVKGANRVRGFDKFPDLQAIDFLRKAYV